MIAEQTPPPESGHTILIVDDEEIVLVALRDTLLREGYKVVASPHAVHALSILQEQKFSVVISDHQMPMITGLDFLAQVKQIQPDATRILITAVLSLGTVIDAINKGEIYRFVVKPWLREELLATVRNAAQRYELIRSNSRLYAETLEMNNRLTELNNSLKAEVAKVAEQNRNLQQLTAAQEKNFRQSVELCVQTMQTFYPTLGGQSRRVAALCNAMAKELNLSKDQQQTLEISAMIHDIGLMGCSRQLIKRWNETPESLTEAETTLIQQHPVLGEELAKFSDQLREIGPTIRAHHEKFDGTGYPDKLKADKIPWLARLLAVAVAYAEQPVSGNVGRDYVARGSGSSFDPEAVRVFQKALAKIVIPGKQRQVSLADLRPGMILAEGIYTSGGMMLIPDGQQLTATYIAKLMIHNQVNPIDQSLTVFC
jgi:response regulator RpfG family c-di-GMP phosphodiesterase